MKNGCGFRSDVSIQHIHFSELQRYNGEQHEFSIYFTS